MVPVLDWTIEEWLPLTKLEGIQPFPLEMQEHFSSFLYCFWKNVTDIAGYITVFTTLFSKDGDAFRWSLLPEVAQKNEDYVKEVQAKQGSGDVHVPRLYLVLEFQLVEVYLSSPHLFIDKIDRNMAFGRWPRDRSLCSVARQTFCNTVDIATALVTCHSRNKGDKHFGIGLIASPYPPQEPKMVSETKLPQPIQIPEETDVTAGHGATSHTPSDNKLALTYESWGLEKVPGQGSNYRGNNSLKIVSRCKICKAVPVEPDALHRHKRAKVADESRLAVKFVPP